MSIMQTAYAYTFIWLVITHNGPLSDMVALGPSNVQKLQ